MEFEEHSRLAAYPVLPSTSTPPLDESSVARPPIYSESISKTQGMLEKATLLREDR
jgi:hypothetical protein